MSIIKKKYRIENMMCAMCVAHVQKALDNSEGVISANVNLANNSALIEYDNQITSPQKLKEAVDNAGYVLVIEDEGKYDTQTEEKKNSINFLKKLFGR